MDIFPLTKMRFFKALLVGFAGAWCDSPAHANSVMSWVPAYEVKDSADALLTDLGGGRTVEQTISRVALQFWVPVEGELALGKRVSEADVKWLTALARQNDLQVLLGVFNAYTDVGGSGFSWDRAKEAFVSNRSDFVRQIAAEMEKLGSMESKSTLNPSAMGSPIKTAPTLPASYSRWPKKFIPEGKLSP